MPPFRPDSGSVLFYILIAVVLFGALSYAVSSSMTADNTGSVSEERAAVMASELMDYGRTVSEAVSRLRLDNCAMSDISFENNFSLGYENTGAPGDDHCNVFSLSGGSINWPNFTPDAFETKWASDPEYRKPIFTIKNQIPQIGSSGTAADNYDLLMIVENIRQDICKTINQKLHKTTTITAVNDDIETKFDGTINTTGVFTFPATFNGWRQGCYRDNGSTDSGNYTYFYVISIR